MNPASSSKIVSIRATPVSVRTRRPCAWSLGVGFGFTRTILELVTSAGAVGLGECEGSAAARLLNERLGQKLLAVQLDAEALGRAAELYRSQGEMTYFDQD